MHDEKFEKINERLKIFCKENGIEEYLCFISQDPDSMDVLSKCSIRLLVGSQAVLTKLIESKKALNNA